MMKKSWRLPACLLLCGLLVWFLADAMQVRPAYVAVFIAAAMLLLVFVILALRARRRKR